MAISSHVKEENCILIGRDDVLSSKSLYPVWLLLAERLRKLN